MPNCRPPRRARHGIGNKVAQVDPQSAINGSRASIAALDHLANHGKSQATISFGDALRRLAISSRRRSIASALERIGTKYHLELLFSAFITMKVGSACTRTRSPRASLSLRARMAAAGSALASARLRGAVLFVGDCWHAPQAPSPRWRAFEQTPANAVANGLRVEAEGLARPYAAGGR